MSRKKTTEEYVQECKDKGLDLPIEDYINNSTKINHKCSKGHIYQQASGKHLQGQGCPVCKKKTTEEYVQECKDKGLDLPIEDYINTRTKINHKCSKGHIYPQRPHNHLQGQGCPLCGGNYSYTPKEYYNLCKEKGLDLPVENYKGAMTKINHKCSKGHIYPQTPNSHLCGDGCSICGGTKKKTPEQYVQECKENGLDLPIEDYINNSTKINHKCKQGHVYSQIPRSHLEGIGCPSCSESKGENCIRSYLDEHCIKYIPQKTFNDLKDKKLLSYDFYLPNYNILIEYQGIQHFESVSFNGKDYTDLDKQKHHDNLKRDYARNNGYKLLRPTYKTDTQEKINRYLDRYLLKTLKNK